MSQGFCSGLLPSYSLRLIARRGSNLKEGRREGGREGGRVSQGSCSGLPPNYPRQGAEGGREGGRMNKCAGKGAVAGRRCTE